jgi:hypothetical protein
MGALSVCMTSGFWYQHLRRFVFTTAFQPQNANDSNYLLQQSVTVEVHDNAAQLLSRALIIFTQMGRWQKRKGDLPTKDPLLKAPPQPHQAELDYASARCSEDDRQLSER